MAEFTPDTPVLVGVAAVQQKIADFHQALEPLALMEQADIPAMPVRNLSDLPNDPHLAATGFFQRIDHPSEGPIWTTRPPIRFSATPARHDHRPAPRLGEHSDEILVPGRE